MSSYFEIILPNRKPNSHRIIGYEDANGCWLCTTLAKDYDGYVKIHINGMDTRLHRIVYKTFVGLRSNELLVMHSCDNPGCCNPNHLEAGTAAENNLAKVLRSRQGNTARRLSDLDKKNIVKSSKSISELAKKYNVSRTTIRGIKRKNLETLNNRRAPDKPSKPLQKSNRKLNNKASNT